jgi:hypothetical protein
MNNYIIKIWSKSMPLDGRKKHGDIVSELIREYKKSGKIGNSEPKDMETAMKQANAIAYDVKDSAKVEALESYITSLVRPETKTFIEGTIMAGFKACFEGYGKLDETPIRMMGRVFYYDSSEGKYYEPAKDMYLETDEYKSLHKADHEAQVKYKNRIDAAIQKTSDSATIFKLINAKHLNWDQDSAREAEAKAMQITGDMPMMEADDLESDDIVRMDTDSMNSDEVEVVQTQLDEIKRDKEEIETKQEEIASKEDDLVNTSAALSLNDDDLNA